MITEAQKLELLTNKEFISWYQEMSKVAPYEAWGYYGRILAKDTDFSAGNFIRLELERAAFSPAEINLVEFKYAVANRRIARGLEVAEVGKGIPFDSALSTAFVEATIQPGAKKSLIRIPEFHQVDEFVSRHIGGRQVPENQWLMPNVNSINNRLGAFESPAVKRTGWAAGTPINGWRLIWKRS